MRGRVRPFVLLLLSPLFNLPPRSRREVRTASEVHSPGSKPDGHFAVRHSDEVFGANALSWDGVG
jgi:hypothetical protein